MRPNVTILLALFLMTFSSQITAQEDSTDYATENKEAMAPPPPAKPRTHIREKIYFGGNLGLSFGTVTSIAVEPLIGWKWTPKLSSGFGLSYWYYKDNRYTPSYESSSYGYRLFTRYRVIPQIYLHAEWAQFFYDDRRNYLDPFINNGSGNVPYLFLGGGLSQPMGSNAHFFVQVLYEVIQSDYSIYRANNDLYVSIGVAAGF